MWMRQLLRELKFNVDGPTPLFMDNQSAMKAASNPEHHGKMKHIEVRHHWIRQEVRRKTFQILHVPTEQHTADTLTKALPRAAVELHRLSLGIM